jgi:predicted ATPase
MITTAIPALQSTGSTFWMPLHLSYLARAYAGLGQLGDARRCIGEAMTTVETTEERWWEAEIYRVAGEIALTSLERDPVKAQTYFERALAVARAQEASPGNCVLR